jgi:hypothetical protein
MLRRGSLRRLALTMVLAMFTALLFALVLRDAARTQRGRVPDTALATLTPVGHQTYYFFLRFPSLDAPWHPGQHLVFTWLPQFTGFTMSQYPSAVQCALAFYGPFPTYAAALAQWEGPLSPNAPPSIPAAVPAFAPSPLLVNDWSSQPRTMVVALPTTLGPGYYFVLYHETDAEQDSSGGIIVTIVST